MQYETISLYSKIKIFTTGKIWCVCPCMFVCGCVCMCVYTHIQSTCGKRSEVGSDCGDGNRKAFGHKSSWSSYFKKCLTCTLLKEKQSCLAKLREHWERSEYMFASIWIVDKSINRRASSDPGQIQGEMGWVLRDRYVGNGITHILLK